ncbi:MAG: diacylglycerol kinase family protein [Candidatus Poseidoniaceae archaeon]|nr:diacylglycerol kinase family protein [Candidatus Poseidoniaceae archaeon]
MAEMHFIVNPASRDNSCGKKWPQVISKIEANGIKPITHMTEYIGHASEIAWQLRKEGTTNLIVAVGGDGTVHEIASALRGSEIPLGILPFGSGNDYAMTQGISRKDLNHAIDVLINGVDRLCAAWRVEGFAAPELKGYPAPSANEWDGPCPKGKIVRWVFLETDAGITSEISRSKLKRAKWIKGEMKYTYLGITTIPIWKRRKVWLKKDDEEGKIHDFTLFTCTTGETFGGGYMVSPGVTPVDKNGTIIYAPRLSRIAMLSLMGPLKKGKHIGKWGITQSNVNRLEIKPVNKSGEVSDEPLELTTWMNIDGEPNMKIPAILEWHRNQLLVRGATDVKWASQ